METAQVPWTDQSMVSEELKSFDKGRDARAKKTELSQAGEFQEA